MSLQASMGPRLFRRGNQMRGSGPDGCGPRFNGATSFQTWKWSWGPPPNPSSASGFNGATSFQTWKSQCGPASIMALAALQWGHVFSDVEMSRRGTRRSRGPCASMGPRLFRRGNTRPRFFPSGSRRCFNGATSFQTWKWVRVERGELLMSRFNGATSFQTWKFNPPLVMVNHSVSLQWGHVFSDVEIRSVRSMCSR